MSSAYLQHVHFHEADNVECRCEYLTMKHMHALCHRDLQYHGLVKFDEKSSDEDEDEVEEEAC